MDVIRRWVGAVAEPATGATMHERGQIRGVLSLITAVVVLALGVLLPRSEAVGPLNVEVAWALVAAGSGATALLPRFQPLWDRLGGVIAVGMIAVLVAATGGITSPYHLLYLVNGTFGAAYYPPRRRVVETALSIVAFVAPAFYDTGEGLTGAQGAIVSILVYIGIVAFVAWLVDHLRSAERQRARAQTRYESAFEASPLPILTTDMDGRIREVNSSLLRWGGYEADEVVGRRFGEFVAREDRAAAGAAFAKLAAGSALTHHRTILDGHGRRREMRATSLPLRTDDQQDGVWTVLEDVTSELTAVNALRASEERYRRLVENLPAVVYYAPPDYFRGTAPLWFISPPVEAWLGYPVAAWVSDPDLWHRIVHPEDHTGVVEESLAAYREGRSRRSEYRVFDHDGVEHWVLDLAHFVPGPSDEPGWVQGVLLDITAEKQYERQLAERVKIQRTLATYAADALTAERFEDLVRYSLDAATTLADAAAATLYRRVGDRIEPIGHRGWPPDGSPSAVPMGRSSAITGALQGDIGEFDAYGPLAEAGFNAGVAVPVVRRGGPDVVLAVHDAEPRQYSDLQRDALRILSGFVGTALDQEQARGAIRDSEAAATALASRLEALVNASPLPIVTARADGSIIGHNHAAERVLGIGDDDLGVLLPEKLPDIGPVIEKLIRAATEGRLPPPIEVTTTSAARGEQVLQLHVGPRSIRPGERDAVVFFVDVTERRMLERHLSQVDKMEALGRLAGGIAHDFNNLLTVIRGYADLARTGEAAPSVHQDLEGIVEATTEGAELVRMFLGVADGDDEEAQPVDLAAAIAKDREFYERALPPHVRLAVATTAGAAAVSVTVSDLRRMLLNLITNAADALGEDGGEVVVRAAGDGETVRLSVRDEGAGMDQETASRVFEPFFTTKVEAGGTGLGLFTVYRLMQAYGGRVEIDSEPGGGTQVTLAFPAVQPAHAGEEEPAGRRRTGQERPRAGRILVVEDDERVRGLTQRILVDAGYDVEGVATGEAAMEALEHGTFSLLLSDVVLPGIDGTAVADVARRLQPGIAIILMSGYASAVAMSRGVGIGELGLLPKPFSSQRLLGRVEAALAAAL